MLKALQDTKGTLEYRRDSGEQSCVKIEIADMGTRDIRLANLPPEIHDRVIKEVLSKYGEVTEIKEEHKNTTQTTCGGVDIQR
jgi:RNA recognition motif-containing protein